MLAKISIATQASLLNPYWPDDLYLARTLEDRGHEVEICDWRSDKDWLNFDCIYVSTTWNIPSYTAEFLQWLSSCESDGRVRFVNTASVIKFCLFKDRYFNWLYKAGERCAVVGESLIPTKFYFHNDAMAYNLSQFNKDFADGSNANAIVIKPIVSADGYKTSIFTEHSETIYGAKEPYFVTDWRGAVDLFSDILQTESLRGAMVQPYMKGIEDGEFSLTFLDYELVCAVKKPGGFRNDLSKDRVWVPNADMPENLMSLAGDISLLLKNKFGKKIVRFRVDFIMQDDRPRLCEIELIEPNNNFSVVERAVGKKAYISLIQALANSVESKAISMKE